MSRITRYGGIVASIVLIAFGLASVVMGVDGRSTVRSDLKREQIVGTPDSTIPNQLVNTGSEAHAFANVMRKTYAQMPRYQGKNGQPTNDVKLAATNPKTGAPIDNPARTIWVTETALSTALNTAYFAERVSTFAIVMGIALLLTGIGFLVLTLQLLTGRAKAKESEATPRAVAPAAV